MADTLPINGADELTSNRPASKTEQAQRPRKPYAQPKFVHYGNIREITRAVGGVVGKNDGGAGKDKTG
jgi:hypothetical protein